MFIIVLILKIYFKITNGVCRSDVDLTGKTILLTGGNAGIGKEFVLDVARRNAKVIMACRNVQKAVDCAREVTRKTGNRDIHVEQCDLSSLNSVVQFCDRLRKQYSQINVLVCFAAAVGQPMDRRLTDDGFEIQFQCNYLSHFLMIQLLIDIIKSTPNSRIILTSSNAHLVGKIELDNISRFERCTKHVFMAYSDSKLALVMLAKELSERLSSTSVWVNSFHPGTVYTDGIRYNKIWYLKYLLSLLAFIYGKSEQDGAQTMIYLTVAEELNGITGHYFGDCAKAPHNRLVDDKQLRSDLWNLSIKLVKPYIDKPAI